jgi:hypothetical protein
MEHEAARTECTPYLGKAAALKREEAANPECIRGRSRLEVLPDGHCVARGGQPRKLSGQVSLGTKWGGKDAAKAVFYRITTGYYRIGMSFYRVVTACCRVKSGFLPRLAASYRILPHNVFWEMEPRYTTSGCARKRMLGVLGEWRGTAKLQRLRNEAGRKPQRYGGTKPSGDWSRYGKGSAGVMEYYGQENGRLNLDRWRGKISIARGNGCLNE